MHFIWRGFLGTACCSHSSHTIRKRAPQIIMKNKASFVRLKSRMIRYCLLCFLIFLQLFQKVCVFSAFLIDLSKKDPINQIILCTNKFAYLDSIITIFIPLLKTVNVCHCLQLFLFMACAAIYISFGLLISNT